MSNPPAPHDVTDPAAVAATLNAHPDGYNRHIGLTFVRCSGDEVVATLEVTPELLQPYGIVHGGVHCGAIETVCSVGAALAALPRNQSVVGLENNTSFLKAVRSGTLTVTATPLTRGRRSQLWEARVTDGEERLVAKGSVRLLAMDQGSQLAGEAAGVQQTERPA
ncbi:MAG: PaaI family thioesterase [Myxococcota bacterium]